MIVTVINQKGGVGKSTTVAHLAHIWSDMEPVVLDLDKQNATRFLSIPGVTAGPCNDEDVPHYVRMATERPVVIDCPPDIEKARHAIAISTHVVVPCICDSLAIAITDDLIRDVSKIYPDKWIQVLATRFQSNDLERDELKNMKHEFRGNIFVPVIPASMALRRAAQQGLTIFDTSPKSKVAREYRRVAGEIESSWQ